MFFNKTNRQTRIATTTPAARISAATACAVERLEGRQLMSAASLDPNFGVGGKVADDFHGFRDHVGAVVTDYNGRTYIAGTTDEQFFVARYNRQGVLDNSFGTGGTTFVPTKGSARAVGLTSTATP